MKTLSKCIFPAIGCVLFLTACGGSDEDTSAGQAFIPDPQPEISFFNDDASTDYVNSMITRFVSAFSPLSSFLDDDSVAKNTFVKRTIARAESLSQSCTGGGNFTISAEIDDVTEELTSFDVVLNGCIENGQTSNGGLSLTSNLDASGDNGTVSLAANNLTLTGGEENIALDGTVNVQLQTTGAESTFTISGPNFSMTAGSESITYSNYSVSAVSNDVTDAVSLSASMTVASTVDGTITFVIDPPLTMEVNSDYPISGTLTMTHSDGSSLALNADNGNPETFDFTINDNGTITTGTQRWDDTDLGDLSDM